MGARVLVCGGRDYAASDVVWSVLQALHDLTPMEALPQGGAYGADTWAMTWAHSAQVPCVEYRADWRAHGRAAGPIRNQRMIEDFQPDFVVAFPGGRGTQDMVSRAEKAGVKVISVPTPTPAEGGA